MSDFQSAKPVLQNHFLSDVMGGLFASATDLLSGPVLHLYTASTNPPNPSSLKADFTEADFSGYASKVCGTPLGIFQLPNGGGLGNGWLVSFLASNPIATPNNLVGYYLADPNYTTEVVLAEAFPSPIAVTLNGQLLTFTIIIPFLFSPNTGA